MLMSINFNQGSGSGSNQTGIVPEIIVGAGKNDNLFKADDKDGETTTINRPWVELDHAILSSKELPKSKWVKVDHRDDFWNGRVTETIDDYHELMQLLGPSTPEATSTETSTNIKSAFPDVTQNYYTVINTYVKNPDEDEAADLVGSYDKFDDTSNIQLTDHTAASARNVSRTFPSSISGENRLSVNFINMGSVGKIPQIFGNAQCGIPNGLVGTHTMYDQSWKFEVNHLMHGTTVLIVWKITNLGSNTIVSVTETTQNSNVREKSGRTICNAVVNMAMETRVNELQQLLKLPEEDAPKLANIRRLIAKLSPKRCTVGLLFFGLLHRTVQAHFFENLINTNPELGHLVLEASRRSQEEDLSSTSE